MRPIKITDIVSEPIAEWSGLRDDAYEALYDWWFGKFGVKFDWWNAEKSVFNGALTTYYKFKEAYLAVSPKGPDYRFLIVYMPESLPEEILKLFNSVYGTN